MQINPHQRAWNIFRYHSFNRPNDEGRIVFEELKTIDQPEAQFLYRCFPDTGIGLYRFEVKQRLELINLADLNEIEQLQIRIYRFNYGLPEKLTSDDYSSALKHGVCLELVAHVVTGTMGGCSRINHETKDSLVSSADKGDMYALRLLGHYHIDPKLARDYFLRAYLYGHDVAAHYYLDTLRNDKAEYYEAMTTHCIPMDNYRSFYMNCGFRKMESQDMYQAGRYLVTRKVKPDLFRYNHDDAGYDNFPLMEKWYKQCKAKAQSEVHWWTLITRRFGLYKDARLLVAKQLWAMRATSKDPKPM